MASMPPFVHQQNPWSENELPVPHDSFHVPFTFLSSHFTSQRSDMSRTPSFHYHLFNCVNGIVPKTDETLIASPDPSVVHLLLRAPGFDMIINI